MAAEAMETFLSEQLSEDSAQRLLSQVSISTLFGDLHSSADHHTVLDVLKKLFSGGSTVGIDLLETAEVSAILPKGLGSSNTNGRGILFGLLAVLCETHSRRMRTLLMQGNPPHLHLVVDSLVDKDTSTSEAAQRLLLALARGPEASEEDFLSALFGPVGGLAGMFKSSAHDGLLRVRLAALLVEVATDPEIIGGFETCIGHPACDLREILGLRALSEPDVGKELDILELLAGMELITKLGSTTLGWEFYEREGVLDKLLSLASAEEGTMEGAMLRAPALQFFVAAIGAVSAIHNSAQLQAHTNIRARAHTHTLSHTHNLFGPQGMHEILVASASIPPEGVPSFSSDNGGIIVCSTEDNRRTMVCCVLEKQPASNLRFHWEGLHRFPSASIALEEVL